MKMEEIKTVVVVGDGSMGCQIAMNTALNGRAFVEQVILCATPIRFEIAKTWVADYLAGRVKKGRLTQEEAQAIDEKLTITLDIDAAVAHADVVIEAIHEDLNAKRELFANLSKLCRKNTILATNSSNIVSSKLVDVVENPGRLLNIHYFNPALVMQLVEIVRGPHTDDETVERAVAFAANTGKCPVVIQKEIAGFVANRINAAVTREACFLLEQGIATVEDIDTACEKGLGYPMGPFRLMDFTGIDVNYLVRRDRYAESGDENDKPSPLVIEKYNRGEYGRKTGKGWYEYSNQE